MKIFPATAKGIEVGFSIEAETLAEAEMIDRLTSSGDRWKGWQIEHGKLLVYPDPTMVAGPTVH